MRRGTVPLHTIAFPALPIISVIATNIGQARPTQAVRALVVALLLEAALLLAFYLWRRHIELAAAMASLSTLYFLSYGHLLNLVAHLRHATFPPAVPFGLLWLAIGLLALAITARIFRKLAVPTLALNIVAIGSLILPMVKLAAFELTLRRASDEVWRSSSLVSQGIALSPVESPPDIYYIILDGYGAQETLARLYNFDNSSFLAELRKDGFYVAEESQSNYIQTALSLASSLNMEYLDGLPTSMGELSNDRMPLAALIASAKVLHTLSDLGYQTVAFSTGYRRTEITRADDFYRAPLRAITPTEALLAEESGFRFIGDLSAALGMPLPHPGYQAHRDQVQFVLDRLSDLGAVPRPRFVFAHVVIPHPPFVFGPDGSPRNPPLAFRANDGSHFLGTEAEYVEGYIDQVEYVNREVLLVVQRILAQSDRTPIIVIQGDHGPGLHLDWSSPSASDLPERFLILNAYLLPGEPRPSPYENISPVNTFRIILGGYFGYDLPLLPDRSFYSTWDEPYRFVEFDTST